MKRAPPKKLFADRKNFSAYQQSFDEFVSETEAATDPALQELESLYIRKFSIQEERLVEIEKERDDLKCQVDELKIKRQQDVDRCKLEAEQKYDEIISSHEKERTALENYNEYVKQHYEEAAAQVESENSLEFATLHAKITELSKAQVEKIQLEKRTKQIVALKRELDVLNEELQSQKCQFLAQMAEKDVEYKEKLEKDTENLTQRVKTLTEKLNDKTMEAVQLSKKVEHVSGERNVLIYQLAEANERVGPLERTISMLNDQSEAYEDERLRNHTTLDNMKRKLSEQTGRIKTMQHEMENQKRITAARDKTIRAFSQELFDLVHCGDKDGDSNLKHVILCLYDRFVKDTENEESFRNPDLSVIDGDVAPSVARKSLPNVEFNRQRRTLQQVAKHMSANVQRAGRKLEDQRKMSGIETAKLLMENTDLRQKLVDAERKLTYLASRGDIGDFGKLRCDNQERDQRPLSRKFSRAPATSPPRRRQNSLTSLTNNITHEKRPHTSNHVKEFNEDAARSSSDVRPMTTDGELSDEKSSDSPNQQARRKSRSRKTSLTNFSKDWTLRNTLRPSRR